ncbi:hypothetical protein C8P67_104448 [Flavobacterium aquicola]|uniref:Uncharacterized protein n=1 Tax=Flavobacterium aquicola TaxID=1682742 RepID=A0A3E0EQ12_9FLAO|nr:hypothetical protein C8P67_104448 [Flavobacterium aquicola]
MFTFVAIIMNYAVLIKSSVSAGKYKIIKIPRPLEFLAKSWHTRSFSK